VCGHRAGTGIFDMKEDPDIVAFLSGSEAVGGGICVPPFPFLK